MAISDQQIGVIPLTWAQRQWMMGPPPLDVTDTWRYEMSLPMEIPPGLTVEDTVRAIGLLLRRYPPLRSRLRKNPHGDFEQEILAPDDPELLAGTRQLGVLSFDPVKESPFDLGRHAGRLVTEPTAPNLMVMLPGAKSGGTGGIAVAHAFFDAGGTHALVRAFQDALRLGTERPVQETLHEILNFERSEQGAELSTRNIRYLISAARRAEQKNVADPRLIRPKEDVHGCIFRSRWLFRKLAGNIPGSRLSRASLMLSLTLIGVCAIRDISGAWIAIPVSNRISPRSASFVGLAMQVGAITENLVIGEPFQQLRDRIMFRLMQCLRHGRFNPEAAYEEFDRIGLSGQPIFSFNHWESPNADWEAAPEPGDDVPDLDPRSFEWTTMPAGATGCTFEFNTSVVMQEVMVKLKYDARLFARADIERFICHFERLVSSAVEDPDVTVARLSSMA